MGIATLPHPQRRIPINELSTVSQVTHTCYADKVTNKISNSLARNPACHQVSLPDALPLPPPPTCPGSSILINSRSEGLLTAENDASLWPGEELTNERTSCVTSRNDRDRLNGM